MATYSKKRFVSPLDWLDDPQSPPELTFLVGTDEWVIEKMLDSFKAILQIEDLEYGFSILHCDDLTPEAAMDALRGGSLLYSGRRLIFLRGTPSGRQDKLRKILEQSVTKLEPELTYVVWQLEEYDGSKRPKLWPYTAIQPSLIIRFDERSDDEMLLWAKYLLRNAGLKLSPKGIQQLANSAQFPYELNSIVEQLRVWADEHGTISDDVFGKLALGEINSVVEEVVFHLLTGNPDKMLAAIYRLDEQTVARNTTTILWRVGSMLHEAWQWLLPARPTDPQSYRWNPYQRFFQDLEPYRDRVTEAAIWETLADLSTLDTSLKTTGAFQQEYRLLVQSLLPAAKRFQSGTQRKARA